MNTASIPALFEAVQLGIYNISENDDIQKQLAVYGFTAKRIQQGQALLNQARLLDNAKSQHYDDARRISLQINQDNDVALELFRNHAAIAKTAFRKEPHVIQELRIKKISHKKWLWTQQAIAFYNQAPQYMERLQQFGADPAAFQQNKAAAEALQALKAKRLRKKGDAEHSTQVKNQAIKELRAWYGEFRTLARVAFRDTPQLLETFGIVVSSSPKKQKLVAEE